MMRSGTNPAPAACNAKVRLTVRGDNVFDEAVMGATGDALRAASLDTVQVNVGLRCNLACRHCHVESSPTRSEEMRWETMELVLDAARRAGAGVIDITGGAPEMNPSFRRFVKAARASGFDVIVRTNLTILLDVGYEDIPALYRDERVHLVASLPCYIEQNVNRQRGLRVFEESIEVIQRLNAVGFGRREELPLDLVYNPLGPSLPPSQARLEEDYRRVLRDRFDISFTRLIAITNLPIGRFQHDLDREGKGEEYLRLLRDSFNAATLEGLMCRHQLHVGHDGRLYDCDFNYALALRGELHSDEHIHDFDPTRWASRRIVTGEHCFGCTAGSGSSCGGSLV